MFPDKSINRTREDRHIADWGREINRIMTENVIVVMTLVTPRMIFRKKKWRLDESNLCATGLIHNTTENVFPLNINLSFSFFYSSILCSVFIPRSLIYPSLFLLFCHNPSYYNYSVLSNCHIVIKCRCRHTNPQRANRVDLIFN